MFDGLGAVFDGLIKFTLFSLFVLLPLSLWKVGEVIWWLCHHISINWQ